MSDFATWAAGAAQQTVGFITDIEKRADAAKDHEELMQVVAGASVAFGVFISSLPAPIQQAALMQFFRSLGAKEVTEVPQPEQPKGPLH